MKLTDALTFLLTNKRSDLTVRQLAVLLRTSQEPCTIRGLAADLNMSKPAVTRAVDKLAHLSFATRTVDQNDRRSVFVQASTTGRRLAKHLTQEEKTK